MFFILPSNTRLLVLKFIPLLTKIYLWLKFTSLDFLLLGKSVLKWAVKMLYTIVRLRTRKWIWLNAFLKVGNNNESQNILCFVACEKLSTSLLKTQYLISEWIVMYLLSLVTLSEIPRVDYISMVINIQEVMSQKLSHSGFQVIALYLESIIIEATHLLVGIRERRWAMIITKRKRKM